MATKNPRLNLVLRPEIRGLIDRLAALQGKSKNRVVTDLLEEFAPALEKVVILTEAAQVAQARATGALKLSAAQAEAVVNSHAQASLNQLDWLLGQMQAEGIAGALTDRQPEAGSRERATPGKKKGLARNQKARKRARPK